MDNLSTVYILEDAVTNVLDDDVHNFISLWNVFVPGRLSQWEFVLTVLFDIWPIEMMSRTILCIEAITLCLMYISVLMAYCIHRAWGLLPEGGERDGSLFGRGYAVCGMMIFVIVLVAMPWIRYTSLSCHQEFYATVASYVCVIGYLAFMSVYYYAVAMKAQTITPAEMSAYVDIYSVLVNRRRHERIRRGTRRARSDSCIVPYTKPQFTKETEIAIAESKRPRSKSEDSSIYRLAQLKMTVEDIL